MGIKGRMFITSSGYDPEHGKHIKDPQFGDPPTLGACRPDIRRLVSPGDYIFAISGRLGGKRANVPQLLLGGFQVAEIITAHEAFDRFPAYRLRERTDGQLAGNVIVNAEGERHELDGHSNFEKRIERYIVGTNAIVMSTPGEFERARKETMNLLRALRGKQGTIPRDVIGRACKLDEEQVRTVLAWLRALKSGQLELVKGAAAGAGPVPPTPTLIRVA